MNESVTQLLLWKPEGGRRERGHPRMALKKLIEHNTEMSKNEIVQLAKDRGQWWELSMSSL